MESATDAKARLIEALSKLSDTQLEEKTAEARRLAAAFDWPGRPREVLLLEAIDRDPELVFRIPRHFTGGMAINEAMFAPFLPEDAVDAWPTVRKRHREQTAERAARITAAGHRVAAILAVRGTPLFHSCGGTRELHEARRELADAKQPPTCGVAPLSGLGELFGRPEDSPAWREPAWPAEAPSRAERIEALADFLWTCEVAGIELPPIEEW